MFALFFNHNKFVFHFEICLILRYYRYEDEECNWWFFAKRVLQFEVVWFLLRAFKTTWIFKGSLNKLYKRVANVKNLELIKEVNLQIECYKSIWNLKRLTFLRHKIRIQKQTIPSVLYRPFIKSSIYRYFTKNRTKRYVYVLQDFVQSYNKTPHRSLDNVSPKHVTKSTKPMYGPISTLNQQKQKKPLNVRYFT